MMLWLVRHCSKRVCGLFVVFILVSLHPSAFAIPKNVAYSQPTAQVEAYDYIEITATIDAPDAHDPFEDAALTGTIETANGSKRWSIEGFCDSADGSKIGRASCRERV